jgi:hypothetical protein
MPYWTTLYMLLNSGGLDITIFSIKGRASIADPSTTSITKRPWSYLHQFSLLKSLKILAEALVAIEPPIE